MSSPGYQQPAQQATDPRTLALIVYGLYIAAPLTACGATVAGVILAYIKREEVRGTIWESHFKNAIETFWVCAVMGLMGVITLWALIGFVILAGTAVYFLYRTIKGLLAAIESRHYV